MISQFCHARIRSVGEIPPARGRRSRATATTHERFGARMIVMTGANGRLGRALATALAERGLIADVTLATRDPDQVTDLAERGFRVVAADFSDPESVTRAFRGAERVVLISATGAAEARIPLHRNAIDAATRVGV